MNIDFSKVITSKDIALNDESIKLAEIATRRYAEETSGVYINEIFIDTSRDSQNLINGAVVSCLLDPSYSCNWKTPQGFIDFSAETIKRVAATVRTHVQSCFDREAILQASVKDGSFDSEMLNEGWPNGLVDYT